MNVELKPTTIDPGLFVLVSMLRLNGVGADPEQIRHQCGVTEIGVPEILRSAKAMGLKARERVITWELLPSTPLPAIACRRDGGFFLLAKAGEEKVLVQRPQVVRPELMS